MHIRNGKLQIQISWRLQKDLQCLQRQGISGLSRTRVNYIFVYFWIDVYNRAIVYIHQNFLKVVVQVIIIDQSNQTIRFCTKSRVLFVLTFYGPVNPMGSCRARSVYLTTRLLGRLNQSSKRLTSIVHILSPETDNCPSWIIGRERMIVENISWSISTKECCRPRGLNPRPPGFQSDGASNWATEAGSKSR